MNVCDICGSEAAPALVSRGYEILACKSCGHRFARTEVGEEHVNEVYSDAYFTGGGAGYNDYMAQASIVRAQGNRYAEIVSRHMSPGRVLDVGSACGFVLRGFMDFGWTGVGVEPNPQMARVGRETFGLDIRAGAIETFRSDEKFDLVCLVQVIGHFYDLRSAMTNLCHLCKEDGFVLIEFWDRGSTIAKVLNKRWHEYSPPSVLHWFNQADVDNLMRDRGFRRRDSGRPKKYISGGHARTLLTYVTAGTMAERATAALTRLVPDRMQFRYPTLDLKWALYSRAESRDQTRAAP